jgi:carbonic anhydrase/acetyltransferase-like protein (isoleucine patch superfamily)
MLIKFEGKYPQIGENVFIAPTAVLIGDVRVGDNASIWFGAVLRGDFGTILVGAGSSIQDNSTIHANEVRPTDIGENVTVGHGAVLEGCTIGRETVIGMNAVILPYAEVGEQVMIAAQSVVPERAEIPSRVLVAGVPAKVKKELEGVALDWIGRAAEEYQEMQARYRRQGIDRL